MIAWPNTGATGMGSGELAGFAERREARLLLGLPVGSLSAHPRKVPNILVPAARLGTSQD
jgi:hypothetical protein